MKYSILVFFLFSTCICLGQNFEGTLSYKNDAVLSESFIEQTGMTLEKMKLGFDQFDQIEITYKNGNYSVETSDKKIKKIYSPERNEILTIDKKSDFVSAILAGVDLEFEKNGKLPTIEIQDTDDIILLQTCKKVVVSWKTGTYEYYYNSDFLKMDASFYSNHVYDMWFEFLNISNALPLKIVKTIDGLMTVTMTLEAVNEHSVKDKTFKLPNLKPHEEMVVTTGNQRYYTIE